MTPTEVITSNPAMSAPALAVRKSIGAKTATIVSEINALAIVTKEDYGDADLLLGRIRQAKKQAAAMFDEKIGVPVLEPMRLSLAALYALRKELTETPFDAAEGQVKGKMGEWKREELRQIEEDRRAAQEEERRQQGIADEQRRQAEEAIRTARTAAAKRQAEELAERARQKQEEADRAKQQAVAAEKAKPVTGSFSRTTTKRVPKVTDMTKFIAAVAAGEIPEILLQVNEDVMEEYWKQDRGLVISWDGVTIEGVTTVGGR